ncbi:MBL fold metallo-hydrolase [Variovorax sp. WDL1]|uniref:MBL fold metallo-hydrolase n=1 Tax=Variovorax sp. WDL1 TaxID=207745 RepID=UPI003FCC4AA5
MLGICVLSSSLASAAAQQAVHAIEVAKDVWFVQGEAALGSSANRNFISNAGFVVTEQGVVVVDALGSPTLAEELIKEIRRVTPQPVKYVILTHYHADHVYGLQAFKATGATVLAQAQGREYLTSDTARLRLEASRKDLFPSIDENTRLVPADRWLDGKETTLKLGSFEFLIRHVGAAHTPEDVVVYVRERKVLFAGDLVFRGRVPFVGQADSRQWIDSLGTLIALKPRIVIPGHGPVSENPIPDLELTRDYLVYLRKSMSEAAANLEPFEEAYARVDWSRYEHLPLFRAANRINAYNTFLLMEQQVPR